MYQVHVWLKRSGTMSPEEFRDHWLTRHAPIARDGYEKLKGYTIDLVTGAPGDADPLYDGVATLTWDSRDDFKTDMRSEAAARGNADLETFTSGVGLLFVERHEVK